MTAALGWALRYIHSATLASLQAPVLRRSSPHPRLHLPFLLALPCTPFINTTLGVIRSLHTHATPPPARLPSVLSNLELLLSFWSRPCSLYLRHRPSSLPALERHPTSPRRPTSARARRRLGCSSLRTCVKRLDRSGVLPHSSTLPPPPSHVGCHQSQSKRHSPFA